MTRDQLLKNVGLAAVIALAPGGFLLGAALLARKLKERTAGNGKEPAQTD